MTPYPCKDCPDRHTACHDTCPKYLEIAKANEAERQKRRQQKKNDPVIFRERLKKYDRKKAR